MLAKDTWRQATLSERLPLEGKTISHDLFHRKHNDTSTRAVGRKAPPSILRVMVRHARPFSESFNHDAVGVVCISTSRSHHPSTSFFSLRLVCSQIG